MTIFEAVPLLEPVEDWFESLWNWIAEQAWDAVQWLLNQVKPLFDPILDELTKGFNWMYNSVKMFVNTARDSIIEWIKWIPEALYDYFLDLRDYVSSRISDVRSWISSAATGIKITVSDWGRLLSRKAEDIAWDINNNIRSGLAGLRSELKPMIDEIPKKIDSKGEWIVKEMQMYFDGAANVITDAFGKMLPHSVDAVLSFLDKKVVEPIWGGLKWAWDMIIGKFKELYDALESQVKKLGPVTPEKAAAAAPAIYLSLAGLGLATTGLTSVLGIKVLGTGLPVGEIGHYLGNLINPQMITNMFLGTLLGVAIQSPLRQYYNMIFKPRIPSIDEAKEMLWRGLINEDQFMDVVARSGFANPWAAGFKELTKNIPGPSDLIRFVVREVITPEDFTKYMAWQGYEQFWANAFWEAHWREIAEQRIHEAYHRGIITKEERDKYLVILDYRPTPRPGMSKSDLEIVAGLAKELIPRVDLRRAWELGEISDEELVRRYEMLGYEDDAPLMARIQKRIAMEALINRLIDNLKKDFIDGFIDEDTIRNSLRQLGIKDEIIEYHIEDAKADRLREFKRDLVDLYIDAFVKDYPGWGTEEDLRAALEDVIVVPEVVDLLVQKAAVRKFRKRRAS